MNVSTEIAMTGSATAVPAGLRFDYSALDADTAHAIMRAADSIKHRKTSIGRDLIGIGTDLIKVKDQLDHGRFGAWLDAEFGWSQRTARNYMMAAEAFAAKSEIVADLAPTVLYALAAPSTPAAVRDDVVRRLEAGEPVPDRSVKLMIKEAMRPAAEAKHRRALKEAREAQLRSKSPQAIRKEERERLKDEEARQKHDAARAQVVAIIVARLGDEMPRLLDLLGQIGPGGIWGLPDELRKAAGLGTSNMNQGGAS